MKNKNLFGLIVAIGCFLISGYFVYIGLKANGTKNTKLNNNEISVTEVKRRVLLPTGKQVYRFSHGENVVGPKIKTLTISELTPKIGSKQTITLEIENKTPITSVILRLITDNEEKKYTLEKKSGTLENGVWEVVWLMGDSYEKRYQIGLDFSSSSGNYIDVLTFR